MHQLKNAQALSSKQRQLFGRRSLFSKQLQIDVPVALTSRALQRLNFGSTKTANTLATEFFQPRHNLRLGRRPFPKLSNSLFSAALRCNGKGILPNISDARDRVVSPNIYVILIF
jgi:hypothetical protein